ncbi:hypothetical protein B566_EDAN001891 [Ephemera danica]|nr:hypothetical protein B566_EDAN001891 [Ephemera danica]
MNNALWIAIALLLLLSFVPRHAGLTSHSLRHHGHRDEALPELVVRPHEEVLLACESDGVTQLVWKHNGKNAQQALVRGDELRLARVSAKDEGVWQCEERDRGSGDVLSTRAVWLVIMEAPRAPYLVVEGRRLGAGARLEARENTALAVRCVVDGGRPAPSALDWLLVGQGGGEESLGNASSPLQAEFSPVERQYHAASELRLERVSRALHNATLVCVASHVALPQPVNATLRLDVQYSPSFAISRDPGFGFPLREGLAVSLKCDVDSNPPASPVWLKDDTDPPVPQGPDGFLNFTAISREHIGWYKCSADHLLGRFASIGYFLNVRYEAELTQQPPRQVEVSLGGGVTLQCAGPSGKAVAEAAAHGDLEAAAAAAATSANCWGRVTTGGRMEPAGMGPELRLDNILYEEAGSYRCIPAQDRPELNERRALTPPDVEVIVTGRPVVYPIRRNLTAVGGSQLSLSVEFCANPEATHAFWLTENVALRPGQEGAGYIAQNLTAAESPHCRRAVLTIPGVNSHHAGEYLFVVRSPRGMAEGMVRLNVTRGASSYSRGPPPSSGNNNNGVIQSAAVPRPPVREVPVAPPPPQSPAPPAVEVPPSSSGAAATCKGLSVLIVLYRLLLHSSVYV